MATYVDRRSIHTAALLVLLSLAATVAGSRAEADGSPAGGGAFARKKLASEPKPPRVLEPLPASFPVQIEQALGQDDPTAAEPVAFNVVFGEPIFAASFTPSDILQNGTATVGAWTIADADGDAMTFELAATALTDGTVIPTLPAGAAGTPGTCSALSATPGAPCGGDADCPAGTGAGSCTGSTSSMASTSADNSVTFGPVGCTPLTYLYVAGWSPPLVYIYCVEADGTLTLVGDRAVTGDVRDLQVALDGLHLYYASAHLTQLMVSTDGSLVEVGTTNVTGGGAFDDLALEPGGRYLYGTHSGGGGRLHVFDTQASSNAPPQIQVLGGFSSPLGVSVSASGGHAFVANQWTFIGDPDTDEEIVVLARNANGTVAQAGHSEWSARPAYFAVHPVLPFVYYTERTGGRVAAAELDGAELVFAGNLFSGHGAAQLVLDAAGSRLYVANHNADDVAVFEVAPATAPLPGSLSLLDVTPSGDRPQHLALHPAGGFLYVANAGSSVDPSTIVVYSIAADGTLAPIQTVSIADQGAYRLAIVDLN